MKNFSNDKGLQTMAHALISRQDHICIEISIHAYVGAYTHPHLCESNKHYARVRETNKPRSGYALQG